MGRLIRWLKEKLTSLFRKKERKEERKEGDIMPEGLEAFNENGELIVDMSTGLTKIVWTKSLETVEPEFKVSIPLYEGQRLFVLRSLRPPGPGVLPVGYSHLISIDQNQVTFTPINPNFVGRPCKMDILIGVCE